MLTVLGNPDLLRRPMVAVVGARNASANGRRLAHDIAAGLGEAGIVVVSGMARGIDAAGHAGGDRHGTVAVVAGGVDIVYPQEIGALSCARRARRRRRRAAAGHRATPARHFPRRNRIISGMALGVVVVRRRRGQGR